MYAPVPPEGVTVTEPLLVLHAASVTLKVVEIARGWVMVTDAIAIHPLESVTVQMYVPALSPVASAFVPPAGDQL